MFRKRGMYFMVGLLRLHRVKQLLQVLRLRLK